MRFVVGVDAITAGKNRSDNTDGVRNVYHKVSRQAGTVFARILAHSCYFADILGLVNIRPITTHISLIHTINPTVGAKPLNSATNKSISAYRVVNAWATLSKSSEVACDLNRHELCILVLFNRRNTHMNRA